MYKPRKSDVINLLSDVRSLYETNLLTDDETDMLDLAVYRSVNALTDTDIEELRVMDSWDMFDLVMSYVEMKEEGE